MTLHTIGILADTHLSKPDAAFRQRAGIAFRDCRTIIHAGDLIDISILNAFRGKEIIAVHGNMCNRSARQALPEARTVTLNGRTIAVCHGAGERHSIADRLFHRFGEADCIVFGHSHQALIEWWGSTLLVNPGSFQGTGPYGSSGTYAILTITDQDLSARILNLPSTS